LRIGTSRSTRFRDYVRRVDSVPVMVSGCSLAGLFPAGSASVE
jgi:hypothetical protein